MSIDKDVKKGIKGAEFDKLRYQGNIVIAIIIGCVVGFATSNAVIGFVTFAGFGIYFARKYFERG